MYEFKNYKLSKDNKEKQSLSYISNFMCNIISENEESLFTISSTLRQNGPIYNISEKLIKEISERLNNKILLIDFLINNQDLTQPTNDEPIILNKKYVPNLDLNILNKIIEENINKFDVIFVNIPPVNIFSNALEAAKICRNIILIEKCSYTRYKDFEESLLYLKENSITISAVIPIK